MPTIPAMRTFTFTFTLHLQSADRHDCIPDVASFVGRDAAGSFGLLAGHADFMTIVDYGLARYRRPDQAWRYVASPGGVVCFVRDELHFCTRRYLQDDDYARISAELSGQLAAEERSLEVVKEHLQRLERELLRRLHGLPRRRA